MSPERPLVAILVGGESRRMGSPKGRIASPEGPTLLERLVSVGEAIGDVVLVGDARAYDDLVPRVPRIDDAVRGAGPIGGLAAALAHGESRVVLVLACDLPFASPRALERLLAHDDARPIVAFRAASDAPFEPLFARYERARVLPLVHDALATSTFSLQKLLARAGVAPIEPPEARDLRDWDTPEDVARDRREPPR